MFIAPCQKRRHIIRTERDGSKREFYKCAHRLAETYRKEVEDSACERCVLSQPLLSLNPCGSKPPAEADFAQPVLGEDAEVRYRAEPKAPPPCPSGYKRRDDDPWVFDPIWYPCEYRVFNNDLSPDGSLKVNGYCALSKKPVDFDECEQCQGALTRVGASLTPETPVAPALAHQLKTYWDAVRSWIAAGRPTRTDDEVKDLHNRFCAKCDWYDHGSKRCKGCGCKVRPEGTALLNKIKMKTEHCPRDFW